MAGYIVAELGFKAYAFILETRLRCFFFLPVPVILYPHES